MITLLFVTVWIKTKWKKEYWKSVIILLSVSLLIQGIVGIIQFEGGSSLGMNFLGESQIVNGMQGSSFITLDNNIYLRAYGTFPHPNVFGGYLLLTFVLGWLSSIYLSKKLKYIPYLIISFSVFFCLFTFSRITILLMFLGVVIFFISLLQKKRVNSFSLILIFERFLNLLGGGDSSWIDRKNLMIRSFDIIKENWFWGTGLSNFVKHMEDNVPRTSGGILLLQPVHNIFLLSFSELGLFNFIPFVLYFYQYFRKFIDLRKHFYLKIFVIIIFVLVGMFDHYLFSLPQGMVISLVYLLVLSV
jgi:O-antigen ligase